MMAKPATTRGQPRSERKGRPPRPDPPLLHRPPPLPTPETRRRRSLRSRRPLQLLKDEDYGFDREEEEDEEEEEEEGRGLRKLRLVVKLHRSPVSRELERVSRPRRPAVAPPASSSSSSPSPASSSSSYVGDEDHEEDCDEEEQTVKPPKKRKIEVCAPVGGRSGQHEDRKKSSVCRYSGNSGTLAPARSRTPMPEQKELESILDKLQKKDTYGAFAEPVDPEELPDYHDVIEHPMDFGTIRKKLARVAYQSFEQFEDDVFLICSNAMQYNAPDTVYFRQASAIQDMAQKKFQEIRNNSKSTEADQRSEEKVVLSTNEKKSVETRCTPQPQCKAVLEPLTSDISSGATLASAGDTCTRLSTVNSIEKPVAVNGLVDGSSSLGESKQEKGDEFSVKCSPSKLGRKSAPVDENRRATYNNIAPDQEPMVEPDLVLNLLEDDQKQLVPVEPEAEYSYARSLARFAVSLGPVAWKIASQKIEKALPPGIKYGPGWVDEYEPLPRPFPSLVNRNKQLSGNAVSYPRAATKDKVTEVKSNPGQNPLPSKKTLDLKKQLVGGIPRKAPPIHGESTSCRNPSEQKTSLGLDGTVQLKVGGRGQEKQSNDSSNLNSGFSNPMSSANCSVASVRVKEESPSEETTERSHVVLGATGKTQRTEKGLPQKKNQGKRESAIAKAFTRSSQQGLGSNPSSDGNHSNFSGIVSREGNHLQGRSQRELPLSSFQAQNNILGMGIGGLNNGIRPSNHFAFSSSNQARANYGLGLVNNRDQASIDPFRLVGFAGKVADQESMSTSSVNGMSYLEKPMPMVSSSARENYGPATSTAAKAWMSAGTAGQWKSVDGKCSAGEPITSSPSFCNNPTWKPTTVNGDPMSRPGNLPIQVFDEASHVKNRGLVIFPQLITTDLPQHQSHPPWQLLSPQPRTKQRDNLPPDLNIGYQPPASPVQPSANMAMDSQQPDLALQL